MGSEQLLLLAFGLLALGALVTAVYAGNWRRAGYTAVVFTAAAAVTLWVLAAGVFLSGAVGTREFLTFSPLGASLAFHIDRLSSIFLIIVPFVALAAMLYSIDYMRKAHPDDSPRRYYPFALLLVAAILGVVTSSDLLFFFIFWECMTLTSWVLVWFDRGNEVKVRAAWLYFVVTHAAAACLLIAILVTRSRSGSFAFTDMAAGLAYLQASTPWLFHVVLGLFFIGFATKAGMFPFGGWLPPAHAAAPSPVSAFLSGIIVKIGIYGIIRTFLGFLPPSEASVIWGGIIAVLGTASIFIGTLAALGQDDAKRVLGFHTIGQVGYMLLGIGTGLFFLRSNPVLASIALIAGLYHVINHSCYKSLLFLNVGAAEYRTGTRDLNKLGGLGALMPVTMAAAVIASLSIAGIPPFNGFVSKWLIYQTTILGGIEAPLFLLLGVVAMFISLVTLASFMKLLGSIFLGKPAPYPKETAGEVPASMQLAQIELAAACIVLGVVPILPLAVLYSAAGDILGSGVVPSYAALFGASRSGIATSSGVAAGAWNPPYMIAALLVCCLGAYVVTRLARATSRQTESWYGGEEATADEVRYRAHGFVLPFKEVFANIYPSIPVPRVQALQIVRKILDFDKWLYNPFVKTGGWMVDRFSRTHIGVPQMYMIWQLAGVILVMAALFALFR